MSKPSRTISKLVIAFAALALAGACSSSLLDPQTESRDDSECIFINGHFICKPH